MVDSKLVFLFTIMLYNNEFSIYLHISHCWSRVLRSIFPKASSTLAHNMFSFVHRLGGSGMSSGMGGGTLGGGHCQLAANQPLVMPVFPLRASQPSPVPVYSPSRFHIDKRCQHRCSWKCLAIAMICLCVILAAMLAYFIGKSRVANVCQMHVCGQMWW